MKHAFTVLFVLLACSSAQAQEATKFHWAPTLTIAAARSFDTISTIRFTSNGSGCTERTPFYRRQDGSFNAPKAWASDAIATGVAFGVTWITHRPKAPQWLRWLGDGANVAAAVRPTHAAIRNFHNCGW